MSATSAPFGFAPRRETFGGFRAKSRAYTIASGYGTAIFKNDPVILNTNGTITLGTVAADLFGVLDAVEFDDAQGRRTFSPGWPAGQVGTNIIAWVWDDPNTEYEVQANGSLALTSIGDQADVVGPGVGNAGTLVSTASLNTTLAGAGSQKQWRIMGLVPYVDNDWGDAFTRVFVTLARHQYVAVKVAI